MKRTELRRGGPLQRRSRLAPVSPRKRREIRESRPVVEAVKARDRHCVLRFHQALVGRCSWGLTAHHLVKQSRRRGGWTYWNLVTLCAWHNEWVENFPRLAHRMGLVVKAGEDVWSAWDRMRANGMPVRLPDDPCCDLPDMDCPHGQKEDRE